MSPNLNIISTRQFPNCSLINNHYQNLEKVMTAPSVFRIADIQDRIDNLPENGTYIKPFVTTAISESMAGVDHADRV